jgi:hypothetical protein
MFALHLTMRKSTSHRRSVHMFWTSRLCRPVRSGGQGGVGALEISHFASLTLLTRAQRKAEESDDRNTTKTPHTKERTSGCRHK